MNPSIQFCGAAETVTGSRHVLRFADRAALIDCGLFQGPRELRERNWEPFPVAPSEIDFVILTHAHMDHLGFLPRLVAQGYQGPVYATPATISLARISLPDSGRLQEEEASYRNRKGLTRHRPALPLYTEKQAYACLERLVPARYHAMQPTSGGGSWRYLPAGHILGSAFVEFYLPNGERVLFSGDLGRYDTPIIVDPTPVEFAEYLVVESTYGDRFHAHEDAESKLGSILADACRQGGVVIVPSFSIGRTQQLLYYVKRLQTKGVLPKIPLYVDSPMAGAATLAYLRFGEEQDEEMRSGIRLGDNPIAPEGLQWVNRAEDSKALNARSGPFVVIAGSGMCQGGRVVHHLLNRLSDPSTIVVFTGYQASGTLGRQILERSPEVTILARRIPVKARIEKLNSLSAHADQGEMMRWLGYFKSPPKRTFIVHGEPPAQNALKAKIEGELGWRVDIPRHLERFEL